MKNFLIGFILIMTCGFVIRAQNLDQDCNPIAVPPECRQQSDSVKALEDRIARLQSRLEGASPTAKSQLLRTIRSLNTDLDSAKSDLRRCFRDHGPTPRELAANELTSRVTGEATMETTNNSAPGPHDADTLDFDLRFSRSRCVVTISRFPSVRIDTEPIPRVGVIRVTITKTGGGEGTFHPVSGQMTMSIKLHFHYSHPLVSDDDANFTLSTAGSITKNDGTTVTGSPLDGSGNMTLVGSGKFKDGFLGGSTGTMVIKVTLSPRP